jgi:ATP-dependent helicase/nuclease subunit B
MSTRFIYGPSYRSLRTAAIERAADLSGGGVGSVLWLEQNDDISDQVADAWAHDSGPLRLVVSTLDEAVRTCYDVATGPRSFVDALTRRRLVDRSLREVDAAGSLDEAHRYRNHVLELLAELEAEGYDSETSIRELAARSPVAPDSTRVLTETYRRYEALLEAVTTEEEFTGSEAYREVTALDTSLAEYLPAVDVVVISGYYELSTAQRTFIRAIARDLPLIITLPVVDVSERRAGANGAAMGALEFYRMLVDDEERDIHRVDPPSPSASALADIAGRLYTAEGDQDTSIDPERLRWIEAPTPEREVRTVARSVRNRIATEPDVTQGNVLVVVPGLISYREEIEDSFAAHGLTPVTVVNKLLYQTYTGRAMLDLVALCRDEDVTPSTIASVATNPLVALPVDGAAISRIARALPTTDIESLLDELDDSDRREIQHLLEDTNAVAEREGAASAEAVRALFESVELDDRAAAVSETDGIDFDAAMEARAYRRVDRTLDAIERVAQQTGTDEPVPVLDVVADELDQIRVPPPKQSSQGVVEVAGPREAFGRVYDHLYLVGMTDRDFPADPDRPHFFEALFDGLDDISPTDHRAVARYQFATMLASAETVRISTPEMTSTDEPLLESPVVDELQRITGIEPEVDISGNGYREDVQRAIGQAHDVTAQEGIEQAIASAAFDGPIVDRVRRGVTCANNRAVPERTDHDGRVAPATVSSLYPEAAREPYSPTRLNSYATCGFRFAMERVLDIEKPLDYSLEPTPLDRGSLVHDVLERFYRELQEAPGDPVDLREWPRSELDARMLDAGDRALAEADLPYDGAFYDQWLETLFAGLGTPESNSHYGPTGDAEADVHTAADGLFAKFIETERDRDRFRAPGWFEVGMDLTEDERKPLLVERPDGTVPVGGRIDRVSVDWSQEPPQGLVHDYKSSSRSLRRAADGLSFQLPLYALAASKTLADEGVETPLDAAFYTLDHGDLGDGWTLRTYLSRQGGGTDEDYQRLVEEVTSRRVGELAASLENGAFQPTVLDEETAGCRYCDFSDVCDVRYHARRDVIAAMDADPNPGYVPQEARPDPFLDTCGGDNDE